MPISHSKMQCSSAPSQKSILLVEKDVAYLMEVQSGAESTDGSEADEVEVIANQEDTSHVVTNHSGMHCLFSCHFLS